MRTTTGFFGFLLFSFRLPDRLRGIVPSQCLLPVQVWAASGQVRAVFVVRDLRQLLLVSLEFDNLSAGKSNFQHTGYSKHSYIGMEHFACEVRILVQYWRWFRLEVLACCGIQPEQCLCIAPTGLRSLLVGTTMNLSKSR